MCKCSHNLQRATLTHQLPIPSCQCQASKLHVRVWDIYPDNDSFCAITIQRHTVKMVYLVSQVCHYSHISMHKKNQLIAVITATKRAANQHNTALPGLAPLLFTTFCPTRRCACATYFALLPNTATPNCIISNTISSVLIHRVTWGKTAPGGNTDPRLIC